MKILVVDDNEEHGVLLGIALRRLGHAPLLAQRADDALAMLEPDLAAVITDIDMPVMDGVELARAVKLYDERIPIVFCTGSEPGERRVVEASELGTTLPKPWTLDQIRELIAGLATLREAPRRTRYRLRVCVGYGSASEFAIDYTENLSNGGMFIQGAQHLGVGERVDVQIALPGLGTRFHLQAKVSWVLDEDSAVSHGRAPGAGLEIVSSQCGFSEALRACIERLQHRHDYVVFAGDEQFRRVLADAGYHASAAPRPNELVAAIARCEKPVVGVVVSRSQQAAYRRAAATGGDEELVHGLDFIEELDEAIARFDRGFVF